MKAAEDGRRVIRKMFNLRNVVPFIKIDDYNYLLEKKKITLAFPFSFSLLG